MSDEYQLRKDIDWIITQLYGNETGETEFLLRDEFNEVIKNYYDQGKIDEIVADIISGDIDLTDYVKKSDLIDETKYDIDLNLSFGTKGFDDTITIDMDIVDYVVSKIINIGDE